MIDCLRNCLIWYDLSFSYFLPPADPLSEFHSWSHSDRDQDPSCGQNGRLKHTRPGTNCIIHGGKNEDGKTGEFHQKFEIRP